METTACILCECNCGIEVRIEDGHFTRIRGDKSHPGSKGYTCEKALRLDHYQNNRDRLTSPLRRRPDGTYEEVDWDTAIREVAEGLASVRDSYGGESILYYGGGGQGNHLGGGYSTGLRAVLGSRFRSSALAQEKTGEFMVNHEMLGTGVRGDFEHTEVAVFVGKNPWQSHGIAEARRVLKAIANDPGRSMVVIDPRRTETADLADYFLQVRPGTDAFCLAALVAILIDDGHVDQGFVDEHTAGFDNVVAALREVPIPEFANRCGISEDLLRSTAERIGRASSVAFFEDLGIQQAPHSTLASYLEKLLWALTGNFGRPGTQYIPTQLVQFARGNTSHRPTPVTGARVIGGLIPCNSIADEILTEHPDRFRAMIIESANPVHSLTESGRMRESLEALDFVVVIDIAMTETARSADYVLPASSQYEKWEATFFNFEYPRNVFQLRAPIVEPLQGTLPEPEIHARLVRALGGLDLELVSSLRDTAERSREEFAVAFMAATTSDPAMGRMAPILLYETLGPTLPGGAAAAAALWGAAHRCAMTYPREVARAGFKGDGLSPGEQLFDAILSNRSGVVFAESAWEDVWSQLKTTDGRINLAVPELLSEIGHLNDAPVSLTSTEFPFILAAGERRSFTANTIFRDPEWRKRDHRGALRMSTEDAASLGVEDGGTARVSTSGGSIITSVEVTDTLRPGHVTLPNGYGLDYPDESGERTATGVSPNDLTVTGVAFEDPLVGTPYHKHVPARVEAVS
jgi:formate dehydrogenase